jgi:hypothetical protein
VPSQESPGVTDRQVSETTTNQNLLARNPQALSSSSSLVISFPALSSRPQALSFRSQAMSSVLKSCHPSSSLVIPTPKAEESPSHDNCAHLVIDACPRLRQPLVSGGSVEFAMDGKGRSCPAPFPAFRTAGNPPPARRAFALQPLALQALLSVLAVCAGDSGQ